MYKLYIDLRYLAPLIQNTLKLFGGYQDWRLELNVKDVLLVTLVYYLKVRPSITIYTGAHDHILLQHI